MEGEFFVPPFRLPIIDLHFKNSCENSVNFCSSSGRRENRSKTGAKLAYTQSALRYAFAPVFPSNGHLHHSRKYLLV